MVLGFLQLNILQPLVDKDLDSIYQKKNTICVFHFSYMIISVLTFFLKKKDIIFFIKTEYVYSVAHMLYHTSFIHM